MCSPIVLYSSLKNNASGFTDESSFCTSASDRCVAEAVDVDDYDRISCNPIGGSKGKVVVYDDGNGGECVDGGNGVVEVKECDESELIGKRVSSLDAAFEVYNECFPEGIFHQA